eukprot:5958638-Prymnesium_polylepis.1
MLRERERLREAGDKPSHKLFDDNKFCAPPLHDPAQPLTMQAHLCLVLEQGSQPLPTTGLRPCSPAHKSRTLRNSWC